MDVSCVVVPAFLSVGCSRVRIGGVIVVARAGPRVRVHVCVCVCVCLALGRL